MKPFFSIIVPTRNRPDNLRKCLLALCRLEYPRDSFEVIVVDDSSSTMQSSFFDLGSDAIQARFLRQKRSGPAAARNLGARTACGDWLVFLDDDCEPDPMWLSAFAAAAPSDEEALGGTTCNELCDNCYSVASQYLLDYVSEYFFTASSPFRFFTSNNLAVAAHRFHRLGGFDTRFPLAAAEDRELCSRWLERGGRLRYVPEAVVRHSHSLRLGSFLRQHFGYGRGAFTYHRLRAQQNSPRLKIQPVKFYADLLRFPWRKENGRTACVSSLLLGVSQAANALGFFYQASYQAVHRTNCAEVRIAKNSQPGDPGRFPDMSLPS
jgi:GT2 family glycosyltransferase